MPIKFLPASHFVSVVILFSVFTILPSQANDTEIVINVGGLEVTELTPQKNSNISMDSEELFLSLDRVEVKYRFTNHAAQDIEALVSFPVPNLPQGIPFNDGMMPNYRDLDFHTYINGEEVKLDYIERAELNGQDVTERLSQLGLEKLWIPGIWDRERGADGKIVPILNQFEIDALVKEGMLEPSSSSPGELQPAWTMVTHVTRRQTFPSGKTVSVTHRYRPMTGSRVGGALDKEFRDDAEIKEHLKKYCADQSFLKGFDRRISKDKSVTYSEKWLGYILHTGANWKGPIKEFKLTVDKDDPNTLVSFCMKGVKKISPTKFEVRKSNFEPKADLDLLFITWHKNE